jgi:GT2 family glycosyltransferase/glycosyltransferase involved in cell wall biosynthesis
LKKKRRAGVVSVILVNFRGAEDTVACVRALLEIDWPQDKLEIVVVDNASGDDSLATLASVADSITLIESKTNSGFTGGCNLGAAKSTGEFIAFLNNDAKPDSQWIASAMRTFDSSIDIGAVASKVLDWEGERVDYVGAAITWYGMGYKPHATETDRGSWDQERDVLFGTGAAMFIRAQVFEELGGFDENYFMFYEDVDLGWRLNLLGYRFRFQPESLAFHKHHASMNKFGNFREEYLLERNALFTLYKNLEDESLREVLPGALLLAVRRAVARGELDSESLDIRRPGGDDERELSVSKSTLAGLYAIDRMVDSLPALDAAREIVQSTRTRSDRELRSLFGNIDEPAYPIDDYLRGYEKIVSHLNVLGATRRRRILIITGDPVGSKMAGPAIRAWNIAKVLSDEHDVRLLSMTSATASGEPFEIGQISHHHPGSVVEHEEWADVIIVQGHALALFPALERSRKILVIDVYDPLHLEQLEQGKGQAIRAWNQQIEDATATLNHQLELGDFFLCASERQRHFWLGQLAGLGRINAYTYSRGSSLESLIAVAPFGIPEHEPTHERAVLRGVVPGIGADDKIVIWAGGIYEWFDPDTLIRAVDVLTRTHNDVRLFFMGTKHPNPDVPEMAVVGRARRLAESLGLLNKSVFFNDSWVAYDQRQNYLLEANVGVSTHFEHVETVFSFRTRILDYLWAGLPMVLTEGDSFGDLVRERNLGAVVRERDVEALARGLEEYLYGTDAAATARANLAVVREEFRWRKTLDSLVQFCREPVKAADKSGRGMPLARRESSVRERRRARPTGLRRDVDRALYYFREGGVTAVADRLRARRDRGRAANEKE